MTYKNTLMAGAAIMVLGSCVSSADPSQNRVSIELRGDQRCISSNGLPNHETGSFPNPGNPHSMRAQSFSFCIPANPVKNARATENVRRPAIALNGVMIQPGTADYWDPSSRRGFSRTGDRAYHMEGMGNKSGLGIDDFNAHVDDRGTYHYHGAPDMLVKLLGGTQVAWAADGHEIHYVGASKRSSWQLKDGRRPGGPGGRYDGQFMADWVFRAGSGDLDKCNGGELNGKFVYFATDTFPFWPRCLWGNVSQSMSPERRGPRGRGGPRRGGPPPHGHPHPPHVGPR